MEDSSLVRAKILDAKENFINSLVALRENLSEDELSSLRDSMRILMGTRPRYKYKPLDREKKEIRIVILHPSTDFSTEPVCDIYHVGLNHEYFALSYVWGNLSETRSIQVNDQTLRVTANLELALRHLRHPESPVPLWIDAICINQEDVKERNYQVGQMRDIYASAVLVIAWTGPQLSSREDDAFELLLQIVQQFVKDDLLVTNETSSWMANSVSPEFKTCSWLPLLEFLERSWFSRAWVVQEVVVSKRVALYCGKLKMNYDTFMLALLAVSAYLTTISEAAGREISDSHHVTHPERVHELSKLTDRFGEATDRVKSIHRSQLERQSSIPPQESFYDVIRIYNARQATDPRDKIFAFLGLAHETHKEVLRIIPDYATEPKEVFLNLVHLHIETHRDLKPLFECCGPDRPDNFPSWMPHWKPRYNPNVLRGLQIVNEIVFKASGDSRLLLNSSSNPLVLNLKGVFVDTIRYIGAQHASRPGEMLGEQPYMPDAVWQSWADIVKIGDFFRCSDPNRVSSEEREMASSDYVCGHMNKYDAFMRTLLMNPRSDLEIDYWNSGRKEKVRSAPKLDDTGLPRQQVSARSGRCCLNRRFFLTEKGYMGLSFPEILANDVVCVFPGLELPFVLRKDKDCYLLIGESYVQGLMSGEAMEDLDAGNLHLSDVNLF